MSNKIIVKKSDFKQLHDSACKDWISKLNDLVAPYMYSEYIEFSIESVTTMREACTPKQLEIFNKIFKDFKEDDLFSITTYEQVIKALKEKSESCPYKKIKQIERLFNGNWKKDWSDRNQYKYYPYFEYAASSGWRFDDVGYCSGYFFFSNGQVAYYKDSKTASHVGKYFLDIYKEIID